MRKQLITLSIGLFCFIMIAVSLTKKQNDTKQVEMLSSSEYIESLKREPASESTAISKEVFEFERKIDGLLSLGDTKSKKPLVNTQYHGHLFIDWTNISASYRIGRFSIEVKDAPEIQLYVEAKISKDFNLLSLREPKAKNEKEEDALLFLKDLISLYAFQSTEDTTGKYKATFKKSPEQEEGVEQILLKKKIQYLDSKLAEIKFMKSIHEIRLGTLDANAFPILEQVSGLEDTQMNSGHGPEFKIHTFYLLKNLNPNQTTGIKKPKLEFSTLNSTTIKTVPTLIETGKISWKMVREKLDQIGKLTGKERLDLFHELVKGLKANPERLSDFMEWAHANMSDPQKASMIIGLLASVGTSETQQNLVKLYQTFVATPGQDHLAHMVLNSLTMTEAKLSPETRSFLNSVLSSHDNPSMAINAAYAVGTAIQKESDYSKNINDIKKLTELTEQTSAVNDKLIYLDAIGNSGSSAFIPVLSASIVSNEPIVREKAVFAMRFINDERVPAMFEQSMNDTDVNVQIAVVKAIRYQQNPQAYTSLLVNCASKAKDKELKNLCSQPITSL